MTKKTNNSKTITKKHTQSPIKATYSKPNITRSVESYLVVKDNNNNQETTTINNKEGIITKTKTKVSFKQNFSQPSNINTASVLPEDCDATVVREKSHKKIKIKKPRAWELDFLRGLAILMVIFDHTMLDCMLYKDQWLASGVLWLGKLGVFAEEYWYGNVRALWKPFFVFCFFFVSGLCTAFSRNNFFRGVKLAVVAIFISVVTYILEKWIFVAEGYFILFGVIHCLSACILFFSILQIVFQKLKTHKFVLPIVCIALSITVLILDSIFNVSLREVTLEGLSVETDSKWLGLFLYVENWFSADYFPLFPFLGYFLLGAGLTPFLYPNKKSLLPKLDGKWNIIFTGAGRNSLIIYLAIQVFAMGLLWLITLIFTGAGTVL